MTLSTCNGYCFIILFLCPSVVFLKIFFIKISLKGPDINSVQWYLYHRTYFPSLPHYATFLGLVKLRLSISHIPIVACSIPDILMKLLEFKSSSQEGINGGLLRTSLLTPHDVGKK